MTFADTFRTFRRRLAVGLLVAGATTGATAARADVKIQVVKSPGGIEAWLVQEDTLPLITMSYSFRGGASQDPQGEPGVANFLSSVLDEGAGDLDSQAFQGRLDQYSIRLGFDADKDAFSGSLRTLSDNRDEAFRLLKLSLNAPRFDQEPIERVRAQIATSIRGQDRNPSGVANRTWSQTAFPNHPYGRPTNGTQESLAAITIDDLKAFRTKVFAKDNLKIAVVGAIDAPTLGRLLDDVFGALPAKADLVPVPDVQPLVGKVISVPMPNPQTAMIFGTRGILRKDPDFITASVANQILGGGSFTSWLYRDVREKKGLAYSIGTGFQPLDHAGIFYGATATRADRADETLDIVRDEIKRFVEVGPTGDEVAKAKSYLIGSYALRFTTSSGIAGQLLAIQTQDLGVDYINQRNGLVAAVTLDDVRRVSKRILEGSDLLVVKVGQPVGG